MSDTPFPQTWLIAQDFDPNAHLMQIERFDKRTQRKVATDYLNVQNRLIWFISDQRALIARGLGTTAYVIQTELIELDREVGWAHFRTYVRDVLGNEATMYGSESVKDFPDYIEKASTKSLGRALLLLGYGTAFAAELDEGDRAVDSPKPTAVPQVIAEIAGARTTTIHPDPKPVPPSAETAKALTARIQAWCQEHGVTGEALNMYRRRYDLRANEVAHLLRITTVLVDPKAVAELYCINLACRMLMTIHGIDAIMREQDFATYDAFWRDYQSNSDHWDTLIGQWLADKTGTITATPTS